MRIPLATGLADSAARIGCPKPVAGFLPSSSHNSIRPRVKKGFNTGRMAFGFLLLRRSICRSLQPFRNLRNDIIHLDAHLLQ